MRTRSWKLFVMVVLCLVIGTQASAQEEKKPNIIFILTDDQDVTSLRYMPYVNELLAEKGTTFENTIFTDPMCCPSRATILRGQYPHNHGVRTNSSPTGGEEKFRRSKLDRSTIATWLDATGYKTAYVGKYLNSYKRLYVPPGWDRWFVQMGGNQKGRINDNGHEKEPTDKHVDLVFANKALAYLKKDAPRSKPFFLFLSFKAAHRPAPYQKRYASAFRDVTLPRPPNFNEADRSDKPAYVRERDQLNRTRIRVLGHFNRNRLRSLQTVDNAVKRIIGTMEDAGELSNTYFFFYTDNGINLGNHTLRGKQTPYEETINFPLIVRGPDVSRAAKRQELVLNNDLAPTIARLAGARTPNFVDGRSVAPLLRGESPSWRNSGLVEGWQNRRTPGYKAIRTHKYIYVRYETKERELYDLEEDPYQLQNIYKEANPALIADLKSGLAALKGCARGACRAAENEPAP